MSVTVVSGLYGGRRLDCPPGKSVRPITARVKGAVFNILGPEVDGLRVLDLYAGSGGFGVEALSRGAASAVFVEKDPGHAQILGANLIKLGIVARVLRSDNRTALEVLEKEGARFGLVLMDPPFARDGRVLPPEVTADLEALRDSSVWDGVLVLEHRGGRPAYPEGMHPFDLRDYGDATVAFFRRGPMG